DGRNRGWKGLIGNGGGRGECRRGWPQLGDVLVGDHHDVATLERLRHRETGVSRVRERRTSPVTRDELRLRQIGNVEDVETVMPIAHIETISDPQRVVTARRNKIVPR